MVDRKIWSVIPFEQLLSHIGLTRAAIPADYYDHIRYSSPFKVIGIDSLGKNQPSHGLDTAGIFPMLRECSS
jgi:hypothetical protein